MWDSILNFSSLESLLSAGVRLSVPLIFGALGETVSQKAGTLNIGLESNMISGAFFGFAVTYWTGSLPLGFLAGMFAGAVFSMLHAFISHGLGQNQSVTGTALNLFAIGITSFLFSLINTTSLYPQVVTLQNLAIPYVSDIPVIGEVFFNKDIITYIAYIMIFVVAFFLKHTVWGMELVAVGENPQAADTVGIRVLKIRYGAALFNGLMNGLAGAFLTLVQLGSFSDSVTSGRGFIALALVVFGKRNPYGIFLGALFIGMANAMQFKLQIFNIGLPAQFFTGLPYILTIAALLFSASKKGTEPASLGKPYIRSAR
jgi:simple sugar transport system permease protein